MSDSPSPEKARSAMKETLNLVRKLGSGASDLLARLRKTKTPAQMMEEMERQLTVNREKRLQAGEKVENLHRQISAGKKALATASPARKRVLEMELRSQLTEYKTAERTLGILLENERTLSLVRGRLEEVSAYGLSGINEDRIDEITDQVDEAASEADSRADALRDLERAGRRRDRGASDLMEELAEFGEESEGALDGEIPGLADFDETTRQEDSSKTPSQETDH